MREEYANKDKCHRGHATIVACLKEQGFTTALAHAVIEEASVTALRIWIIDNSGSMNAADGQQLVATKKRSDVRWVKCTRFAELQECVMYHAQLSALLDAPTKFTLLNDPANGLPPELGVAEMGQDMIEEELRSLKNTLTNVCVSGVTPLTKHLTSLFDTIQGMEVSLRRDGRKIAIILATDGLPTDEHGATTLAVRLDFSNALRRLQLLPVWIVIRLCTDEESILAYYENLDAQLELSLEVLDDFEGEAKEVYRHNPWLTYSLVLHRCREMGFSNRLMDLLDERRFTMDEMVSFLRLILIGEETKLQDPHADWAEFKSRIQILCNDEEEQYNAIKKRSLPWIDIRELERIYGPKTFWSEYLQYIIAAVGILIAIIFHSIGPK